jgi:hypothetical protein
MALKIIRKTIKRRGDKIQTHVEEIDQVGDKFNEVTKNYVGSRLTKRNVTRVSKKQVNKVIEEIEKPIGLFSFFKRFF